mgnify:CR=1 FL=1
MTQEQLDWTGDKNSVFKTLGSSAHSQYEREERDYYATDPIAISNLLEIEQFDNDIWECACGGGHMVNRLREHGHNVFATDIVYRGGGHKRLDFLSYDALNYLYKYDIITNPPYRYALEFVNRATLIAKDKVAMFLRLQFLETQRRYKFFKQCPPSRVLVFSSRIQCAKNGEFEKYKDGSAQAYAWFIWEKGFSGNPVIKWIPPNNKVR